MNGVIPLEIFKDFTFCSNT